MFETNLQATDNKSFEKLGILKKKLIFCDKPYRLHEEQHDPGDETHVFQKNRKHVLPTTLCHQLSRLSSF